MSDLINRIRTAQVRAAEDLVLDSLREKGLLTEEPIGKVDALKRDFLEKHRAAEKAAWAYFCECPVGDERTRASEVYENIRTATRVG
jgi:hypothetical protein